jgi:hypothetical protein
VDKDKSKLSEIQIAMDDFRNNLLKVQNLQGKLLMMVSGFLTCQQEATFPLE